MARGIKFFFEKAAYALTTAKADKVALRRLVDAYNFSGYKRLYLFHIRKTGGTSLNNMFLSLSGGDPRSLYQDLVNAPRHRIIENDLVFVGWNTFLLSQGDYFYGFSHASFQDVSVEDDTFTFTCFRDPVRRVISYYNMLMSYRENHVDHSCMAIEGDWLGASFDDFLCNLPKQHLLNQLYMFSNAFDVDEALENVKTLSHFFFTEDLAEGVAGINQKTGLQLVPVHVRKSDFQTDIRDDSLVRLRKMLDIEYRFLDAVRSFTPSSDS